VKYSQIIDVIIQNSSNMILKKLNLPHAKVKGIVLTKMKILSSFSLFTLKLSFMNFFLMLNTKRYFDVSL